MADIHPCGASAATWDLQDALFVVHIHTFANCSVCLGSEVL